MKDILQLTMRRESTRKNDTSGNVRLFQIPAIVQEQVFLLMHVRRMRLVRQQWLPLLNQKSEMSFAHELKLNEKELR